MTVFYRKYNSIKWWHYGIVCLALLSSCLNNNVTSGDANIRDNEAAVPLPIYSSNQYDKNVSPEKLIKDVQILKLGGKADPQSIIAEAGRVFFLNSRYYIWDQKFSGVKVFDAEGHFLFPIGKVGKGPGEYVKIYDMQLLDSSRLVLLCDAVKLEFYDLSGNHLKTTQLGMFARSFNIINSNRLLFYIANNFTDKSKNFNLLLTDSSIGIIERYFESKAKSDIGAPRFTGFLSNGVEKPLYSTSFDDKIYDFTNGTLQVKFKFDLANKKLPADITLTRANWSKETSKVNRLNEDVFETENHLFFTFKNGTRVEYGILDKKTNTVNIRSNIELSTDYFGRIFYVPLGRAKDTLLIGFPPEKIVYLRDRQKEYVESIKKWNEPLYELIRSYRLNDNYVILKCTLK